MDPRSKALSALERFQVTGSSVGETRQRIADITVESVPAAAVVGMTMLADDGQPTTGVYTDEDAPEIDEAQYREGKGPGLDACRQNRVFRVPHVPACSEEHPGFVSACLEHGVFSTLSLPLVYGDTAI